MRFWSYRERGGVNEHGGTEVTGRIDCIDAVALKLEGEDLWRSIEMATA